MKWMALYLAVMNLLGVYLMWTDKRRAKKSYVARTGKGAFRMQPARGQHRHMGGNVSVPAQNKALVFCGRDASHSALSDGACHLWDALIFSIIKCYRKWCFYNCEKKESHI